jgi:hypothetical protein
MHGKEYLRETGATIHGDIQNTINETSVYDMNMICSWQ